MKCEYYSEEPKTRKVASLLSEDELIERRETRRSQQQMEVLSA